MAVGWRYSQEHPDSHPNQNQYLNARSAIAATTCDAVNGTPLTILGHQASGRPGRGR